MCGTPPLHLNPLSRRRRWLHRWIWLCVAAVLGFQMLGLVHRTLHGAPVLPSRLAIAVVQLAAAAETADTVLTADSSATLRLASVATTARDDSAPPRLGHAAGTPDCQLLDQLSHALGPGVQAMAWTALLPDHPVSAPQPHDATLAQVWRKAARGPPLA